MNCCCCRRLLLLSNDVWWVKRRWWSAIWQIMTPRFVLVRWLLLDGRFIVHQTCLTRLPFVNNNRINRFVSLSISRGTWTVNHLATTKTVGSKMVGAVFRLELSWRWRRDGRGNCTDVFDGNSNVCFLSVACQRACVQLKIKSWKKQQQHFLLFFCR